MSTQTTAVERSNRVVFASYDTNQTSAYLVAVSKAVSESISLAKRRDDTTEKLPIITVSAADGSWRVVFDALADLSDDERSAAGDAVAKAYDDPWNREAVCLLVQPGDSLDNKPLAHLASHANELHKALTAYSDEVRAGACPVATLAAHLQRTGEKGAELAADVVALYTDNPALVLFDNQAPGLAAFPYYFALAIWHDVITPAIEREAKNARNPAAVTLGTYGTLEAVMFTKNVRIVANDRQPELFVNDQLAATAHLKDMALVDVLTKATPALRSYAAARLLVWAVNTVKTRHFLGEQYPNILTIEGGLSALAELVGIGGSNNNITALRQILTAGQAWNVSWEDGREVHGLWNYHVTTASRAASASVTITVAAALTPHGAARGILTPIVSIDDLGGITAPRYMGPLAAFKQGIVKAIVDQRLDLPKHGGALITARDFDALALRCGVPKTVTPKALQAWQTDRDEGPAFLEVTRGRFHIANNEEYGAVRAFIDDTASIARSGSIRGKKSAQKRAAKPTKK